MADQIWLASTNEERWMQGHEYPTEAAAIAGGAALAREYGVDVYWTGTKDAHSPGIIAEDMIERLGEAASEECGEYAEDWLYKLPAVDVELLGKLLNDALDKWLSDTCNHPHFYTIGNMTRHRVPEGNNNG